MKISDIDGEACLRLSKIGANYTTKFDMLTAWNVVSKKYKDEQITKEEYDVLRYNYPKFDNSKT